MINEDWTDFDCHSKLKIVKFGKWKIILFRILQFYRFQVFDLEDNQWKHFNLVCWSDFPLLSDFTAITNYYRINSEFTIY